MSESKETLPLVSVATSELANHAAAIRMLGKRVIANVIEIGQRLTEAKKIAGQGNWRPWLEQEFGWSEDTAERFMSLHRLQGQIPQLAEYDLPVSGLYLLAAPSTPEEARAAVIEQAENGEALSVAGIKKTIDQARGEMSPRRMSTEGRRQPASKARLAGKARTGDRAAEIEAPIKLPASNFARLVEAWKVCTPEEQRQLLNQNNAVILTDAEGRLRLRGFHVAALRDSDRQTRIRELRALLTAFDLTAHDLFPSTLDEPAALRAALAVKLTECDYDLVNTLWVLHNLRLIGELSEKNVPAIVEAKPPFDHLGLVDLSKAIADLGHAWRLQDRHAQQHEITQNRAAPPADNLDGVSLPKSLGGTGLPHVTSKRLTLEKAGLTKNQVSQYERFHRLPARRM
jgi:hypothetical protein